METWELEARESIRDLVARYNANGDSGRFDDMMAVFCDDAVLELDGQAYRGKAEIRGFFEGVARGTDREAGAKRPSVGFIRHHTATHQIDVESETEARGRCYFQVLTDRGLDHWGRYVDRYRLEEGTWRIAERRVSLDHAIPGGWGDAR